MINTANMKAYSHTLARNLIVCIAIILCSLSNYVHTAYQATSAQKTNNTYYYPLSEKSFLKNPITLCALSVGTYYASLCCLLFTQKGSTLALLSGIAAIGSGLYAEYAYRKALYNIPIKQINVRTQEGGTCVVHAIANALTLHDLLLLNTNPALSHDAGVKNFIHTISDIDNTNFYNYLHTLLVNTMNVNPAQGLNQHTTAQLIKKLNKTDTIFQLTYDQIKDTTYLTTHLEYSKLKNQIAKLYNQTNNAVHIKCTLTYPWDTTIHAIMISLIKQKDNTISIIYMDSNNIPLRFCPQAVEYIRFIYDNLLQV